MFPEVVVLEQDVHRDRSCNQKHGICCVTNDALLEFSSCCPNSCRKKVTCLFQCTLVMRR